MPFPPSFAPELVYFLVDQCSPSVLKSCSLVSRTWRCIAQRLLLRRIVILLGKPTRNLDAFATFLDLRPTISLAVHQVHFQSYPSSRNTASVDHLRAIFSRLPQLQMVIFGQIELTYGRLDPPATVPASLVVAISPLHKIKHLELAGTRISAYGRHEKVLLGFLGLFSSVDSLVINTVDCTIMCKNTSTPHLNHEEFSKRHRVRALNVETQSRWLFNALVNSMDASYLTALRLADNDNLSHEVYDEYQACINAAVNLSHIEIHLPFRRRCAKAPLVSLSSCKSLEILALSMGVMGRPAQSIDTSWQHSQAIIDTLPSCSPLRTLNLIFTAPNAISPLKDRTDPVSDPHWTTLLRSLDRFGEVKTINILIEYPYRNLSANAFYCHNQAVVDYFRRNTEDLFPSGSRRYGVTVDFAWPFSVL